MDQKDVVFLAGARTPMTEWIGGKRGDGKPGGALASVSAIDLGAIAAKEAVKRAGLEPADIEHVIMGNALQTSGDALYGARHVALKAGMPKETPALTVNRLCGSGIQSIVEAAHLLKLGEANLVVAGGMENLSQAPHVLRGLRVGLKLGQGQLEDSLMVSLLDTSCGCYMAQTSDNLAREYHISREEQDDFAHRSHTLGTHAVASGRFAEEIVPVPLPTKKGDPVVVRDDDHFVPNPSREALGKLPPAFGPESFVTAGNASGIVDGAAAMVVATAEEADKRGKKPLGRVVSWGYVGVEPKHMGIGPVPAIRKALERAGLPIGDVDLFEINEAFAGQYLAVEKCLKLDREKVNVNGGAIALGHPLGATGTRLVYTLLVELAHRGKKTGVAAACIGGGQGIAMVVQT
ncbi:MAG TPA: acetyl-CoA C-acetyltransferase [Candidatus Eisenbacteria bacterium]|nr:acetyl-CoA C-acetyltransferase [Candidatus Eisenbacteria bacterium]